MLSAHTRNARRIDGSFSTRAGFLLGSIVIAFSHVLLFTPAAEAAEDGAIAISTLIPYAENAEIRDSIRQECGLSSRLSKSILRRSVKKKIPMIRLGNPNETLPAQDELGSPNAETSTESHRTLELRINDAIETSGGLFPTHSLSIDGVFKVDGRIVGTFVATRFARASFIPFRRGECAILSEAATLLAKDVVKWIKKPTLDSRLGDAR
jgi:hypothetical protein